MRGFIVLAALAILAMSQAPTYADCANGQCRGPARAVVVGAAKVGATAVRATAHVAKAAVRTTARVAAAPVKALRHTAHAVREHRPARRVLRGAARVVFRPLARIRFACQ